MNHSTDNLNHTHHKNQMNHSTDNLNHTHHKNQINHSSDNNEMIKEQYKYSELTSKIIGCSIAVHKILSNGFQEVIYQRALEIEMRAARLSFSREHEMPIYYANEVIGTRRVDFLVEGIISVELKAITKLEDVHLAQAINYLEVYDLEIGLLINFGEPSLRFKRLTNKKFRSSEL